MKLISKPHIFFNASIILAGLASPAGGSAKLLQLSKQKVIKGSVSEIIVDEVLRRAPKINLDVHPLPKKIVAIFEKVHKAPSEKSVSIYKRRSKIQETHTFWLPVGS